MKPQSRLSMAERLREDYGWTPRQREVLDLVSRGRSNTEIAEALGISLSGAKWHVSEILSKLHSDSREEAAEYWRRYNGLAPRFARIFRGLSLSTGLRWGGGVAGVGVAVAALVGVLLVSAGDDDKELAAALDPSATVTGTRTAEPTATPPPEPMGTPASPGDFTVRREDQLLVCVAVHPDLGSGEELAMATALLAQVEVQERDNPLWQSSVTGGKSGVVAAGCPGGYRAPPEGIGQSGKESVDTSDVGEPSAFPIHFFVIPDSLADRLEIRPYGRAGLERACTGHVCAEVTTAIYASAASFRDPAVLRSILLQSVPWYSSPQGTPSPSPSPTPNPTALAKERSLPPDLAEFARLVRERDTAALLQMVALTPVDCIANWPQQSIRTICEAAGNEEARGFWTDGPELFVVQDWNVPAVIEGLVTQDLQLYAVLRRQEVSRFFPKGEFAMVFSARDELGREVKHTLNLQSGRLVSIQYSYPDFPEEKMSDSSDPDVILPASD